MSASTIRPGPITAPAPTSSSVIAIEIRTNGDNGPAYTTGSVYIDNLELNPVSPAEAMTIEDFEDLSDWVVSVGPAANGASLTYEGTGAQVGSYAGAFNYQLSSATGNDYVNFEKSVNLDLSTAQSA